MTHTLKRGKRPHVSDDRDILLADAGFDHATVTIPSGNWGNYPLRFGKTEADASMFYDFNFPLGILGNDEVGDCVPADAAHEEELDALEGDHSGVDFDTEGVVSDYSVVTGYKPGDPATDGGTEVRAYLRYQRKTGIVTTSGKRKRIGLFGQAAKPKSVEELLAVVAALGKVRIGFECTNRNMEEFNARQPFTATPTENEGHCVSIEGVYEEKLVVCTWGTLALMEFDCYEAENDEAWGYYSTEMLKGGRTISGLDKEKALAVVAGLS